MSKLLREAPMIVMESDEVAKLNADSHNYRSRLKENSPLQRIAISLGRYFLNACAETLNL